MKSFSLLVPAYLVANTGGKVHEFFAESNFVCGMCQQVLEHTQHGRMHDVENIFAKVPALEAKFNEQNGDLINYDDIKGSCAALHFCENETTLEMYAAQKELDLLEHIETVNSGNHGWVAGENYKFKGMNREEVRKLMGTVVDPQWTIKNAPRPTTNMTAFPTNFDSRVEWPECAGVIGHIRDQSNCGSCWAHGTTEALNDRTCIATGGAFQDLLSVSDTAGCCDGSACFSFDCNGGQVGTPWGWFNRQGVVTGGDYGNTEWCYAYTMHECAHHVAPNPPQYPSCDDVATDAPMCLNSCPSNTSIDYANDKHFATSSYGFASVDDIKADIMAYGTVTNAFTVYEDFLTYQSGVYRHTSGASLGGHSTKTIGWGVENGEDYWLCANSWNETWGDGGYFKILMGDCGINDQNHAGHV